MLRRAWRRLPRSMGEFQKGTDEIEFQNRTCQAAFIVTADGLGSGRLRRAEGGGQGMRWDELDQEKCSIARTLSVIGDRWTLLILRECFRRVRRFDAFEAELGITRHVLADRLRKLVEAGVLERTAYQERPRRHEYRLTAR